MSEPTIEELRAEAIAQGYKDETCPKCGAELLAHHHFVRCDAHPCPMRSTTNTKSVLEMLLGDDDAPHSIPNAGTTASRR